MLIPIKRPGYTKGVVTGVLLAAILFLVYALVIRLQSARRHVDDRVARTLLKNLPRPVLVKLVSGEVVVKAGQYRFWTVTVDPQTMTNVHVAGNFHASGGTGNDIQVVLAEQNEFENWKNGHQALVLYSSGQTTNGKFDVALNQVGTYVLAFSNKFSIVSDKEVSTDVAMRYLAPPQ